MSGAEAQDIVRPDPLQVSTLEPVDEDEYTKAGVAFFTILILYGQLLTYGYWVASGVVEEKASRVVEVALSTIRPAHLLAGKVIGLGLFLAFAVNSDPDGTLAHVTAFIPMTAPITMPPRIVTGDAPAWEVVASFVITIGAAALLIPLAARIYSGGILRTGSALKLREAWRAARAS